MHCKSIAIFAVEKKPKKKKPPSPFLIYFLMRNKTFIFTGLRFYLSTTKGPETFSSEGPCVIVNGNGKSIIIHVDTSFYPSLTPMFIQK